MAKDFSYKSIYSGFSLIELIVSLSILAILSSVAIPNLKDYIDKSHFHATKDLLRSSLSLARETAIHSGHDTYICELIDKNQCNPNRPFNANWSNGWIVFEDINGNGELDKSDEIYHIQHQINDVGIIFNQRGRLRFRANGSARSAGFYICNSGQARHILVLYSGRIRTKPLNKKDKIEKCLKSITKT